MWPHGPHGLSSHGLPALLPVLLPSNPDPRSPPHGRVVLLQLSRSPRGCRCRGHAVSAGADGGVGPTFIPCSRSTCHAGRSREQMRPRFSCPQGISVAVEGEGHLHLCLPGARPPAHGAPRDRPAVCTQHGQAAGREPGSRPNLSPADWSVERAGEEQGPPLCLVKGGSESRWERSRVTAALQSPAEAAPLETETPATASFPEVPESLLAWLMRRGLVSEGQAV